MDHQEADLLGGSVEANGAAQIIVIDHGQGRETELVGAGDQGFGRGGAIKKREGGVGVELGVGDRRGHLSIGN